MKAYSETNTEKNHMSYLTYKQEQDESSKNKLRRLLCNLEIAEMVTDLLISKYSRRGNLGEGCKCIKLV